MLVVLVVLVVVGAARVEAGRPLGSPFLPA
jgi:hypothetical protein